MKLLNIKRFPLTINQADEIESLFELNAKAEKPGLIIGQMKGIGEVVFSSCVYIPHEYAKRIQQVFDDYAKEVSKKR